ncbi:MAG: DUF1330 domain-containing protein [Deltaproteobacteria bacterium]|nr:DUF1330 domain-containing protein [Deltaproteobacteria bacterium]
MTGIKTNKDAFQKLAQSPHEGPFVMLNLLKFHKQGGREAYLQYIQESGPFVEHAGGKVLYFGKAAELLNGAETWDIVMLVQYPRRKAFLEMAENPDYLKVHELRERALERAVLYVTDPIHFKEIL